jgi:hypothetical protein
MNSNGHPEINRLAIVLCTYSELHIVARNLQNLDPRKSED